MALVAVESSSHSVFARLAALALALVAAVSAACGPPAPSEQSPYPWRLPPGTPAPRVPDDNPMNADKALLGRFLFYDVRLSGNQTQSCGTCHQQARAFADERATGLGSTGESHPRNPMGLTNVAYQAVLTWASPIQTTLERQALLPLFGEHPVELGLAGREDELLARLRADARYVQLFRSAFPGEPGDAVTVANVARALGAFQRTLISANSPFDRFQRGDMTALSESARRGLALFNSERLECYHCHAGFNFADSTVTAMSTFAEVQFHNTGLYNIDGMGGYPADNRGLYEISNRPEDMGRFRTPTLRNIELTAPYMHDGSIATLDEVIDHYAAGGRTIASGPNAGVGRDNPFKSDLVRGFTLTAEERQDLLAFLRSLTDHEFVTDPRFSNPFSTTR